MKGNEIKTKGFGVKKTLIISILCLLFFFVLLLVYEYIRITPRDVHFSNITSSSVTVSWNTKSAIPATVIAKEGKGGFVNLFGLGKRKYYDSRDVTKAELEAASQAGLNREGNELRMENFQTELIMNDVGKYYTHHVVVKGLEAEKEYSFMVGDSLLYRKVSSDEKSSLATLPTPESILVPYPTYGVIKDAQNIEDTPIDELESVTDAIVYLNYLDQKSGDRSNLFSSSLSTSGSWYIDTSGAVNSEGNDFITSYTDIDTEILVELVVDAGDKGIWKSKRHNITSPAEPFVINILNSVVDEEEIGPAFEISLGRNIFVKSVLAKPDEPSDCNTACQFINYCGPCQKKCSNGYWYTCECNGTTLANRQCNNAPVDVDPEVPVKCTGGHSIGTFFKNGSTCYECRKVPSGTYYYAGIYKVENSKCDAPICTPSKKCSDYKEDGVYLLDSPPSGSYKTFQKFDGCKEDSLTCYLPNSEEIPKKCDCEAYGLEGGSCSDSDSNCTKKCVNRRVEKTNECTDTLMYCFEACTSTDPTPPVQEEECTCRSNNYSPTCEAGSYCKNIEVTVNCNDNKLTCYDKKAYCQTIRKCENLSPILEVSYVGDKCPEGKSCVRKRFDSSECGVLIECYILQKDRFEESISEIKRLPKKTPCSNDYIHKEIDACYCFKGSLSTMVITGEYCLETRPIWYQLANTQCIDGSSEGDICRPNGTTCVPRADNTGWPAGTLFCEKPKVGSNRIIDSNKKIDIFSFIKKKIISKVKAENTGTPYLLDSKTGLFLNLPVGTYIVEYQGQEYSLYVDTIGDDVKTLLYIDTNDNKIYDEGIDTNLSENAALLNLVQIQGEYTYTLKTGFNFVSFPFLVETSNDANTAAALLLDLNDKYQNSIYSIAKYDSSWKIVGQNAQLYDANDFQLIPGQGYVIKAKNDVTFTLKGQPVRYESSEDTAPITIVPGWNLIGLYGTNTKQYTAKSMLQDINAYDKIDFSANNVSRWDSEVQGYDGFQLDTTTEYGFDYPINQLGSYFVRVQDGTGNWQPQLAQ